MGHGICDNMNAAFLMQWLLFAFVSKQAVCSTLRFHVQEEQQEGVCVGTLSRDYQGPYQLFDQEYVSLHEASGDLFTKQIIDRESACPLQDGGDCTITLYAVAGAEREVIEIVLIVEDINDNAPYFPESVIQLSVPEDSSVEESFALDGKAQDADSGLNGEITYHMLDYSDFFAVKEGTHDLVVVLLKELDRETRDDYQLTVIATDHGSDSLSATATIKITVTDVNDNCPEFDPESTYLVTIREDTPKGSSVAQLRATDRDIGDNAAVAYSLSRKNSAKAVALFHLDEHSGQITLANDIYADRQQAFVLRVQASGPLCSPAAAQVTISVQPVTGPESAIEIRFIAEHEDQTILLQENIPPTALALLELKNGPSGCVLSLEGDVPFSLKLQPPNDNYLLSSSKPLDFEVLSEYHITIVSAEPPGTHLQHKKVIKVQVVDVNDNAPRFNQTHYQVEVEENNHPGACILQVNAFDPDSQHNGMVFYRLSANTSPVFRINRNSGELIVAESLDCELKESYVVTVLARDGGSPPLESSANVFVRVLDTNDNAPAFLTPHFIFFVLESLPRLALVGKIGVKDLDKEANGHVEVRVVNGSGPFVMDNAQGALRSTEELDRESCDRFELFLVAFDGGRPSHSSNARVTVFVEDINDNQPKVILPSSNLSCLTISPSTPPGAMVTRIYAVDEDSGINSDITYHLVGSEPAGQCPFQIDSHSGNVSLTQRLLGQDHGMHHLLIVVSDGGKPNPLQTTVWVNLLVNETVAQCQLYSVPKSMPSRLPRPTVSNQCSTEQHGQNPKLILLAGMAMLVLSLCLFLIAVGLFVKQRNMRHHVKTQEIIPLRAKHSSDHWGKD